MLNQNNEEFSTLARNSAFLLEFMGDVTIYTDRKMGREAVYEVDVVPESVNDSQKAAVSETLPQQSPSVVASVPATKPSYQLKIEKPLPSVAIWLGKVNGQIPPLVDKLLEAISLTREQCHFWANQEDHPVQLCKNQPEIRKVLVLAPVESFPKLKPDAPLFHEGVTYLRSWDVSKLEQDIEAKKLLWKLMKTHFLNKK